MRMTKYTTLGRNALSNAGVSSRTESVGTPRAMESGTGGQHTDPSVKLGPLNGPAACGEVPLATTMRKPQAYRK